MQEKTVAVGLNRQLEWKKTHIKDAENAT
jgi:hypothetical protein